MATKNVSLGHSFHIPNLKSIRPSLRIWGSKLVQIMLGAQKSIINNQYIDFYTLIMLTLGKVHMVQISSHSVV